ncbi:MAG: ArnT family glycosyltransferase, partial [Planctomycetaceae bacterium]
MLPAGYVHLRYGRFDVAQVNPPLSRMLCALPLLLYDIDEGWSSFQNRADLRLEYEYGPDFVRRNSASLQRMLFACRSVVIPFSVLGAVMVALIARNLYGGRTALAALVVWCCSPMVLGHAATTNHDVPGAALLAAAFLALLVFRDQPSWLTGVLLGLVSGLALLTRTTCAPVVSLWLVLHTLTPLPTVPATHWLRRLGQSIGIAGLAVFVLNAGYGFSGTLTKLGDYTFFSAALSDPPDNAPGGNRLHGTLWADLLVPLPKDYVQGLDLQQLDFESPPFESYLLGEWRPRGWWYYYLVG